MVNNVVPCLATMHIHHQSDPKWLLHQITFEKKHTVTVRLEKITLHIIVRMMTLLLRFHSVSMYSYDYDYGFL